VLGKRLYTLALPHDQAGVAWTHYQTGITFAFGGLAITEGGQVIDCEQRPIPGLYAAGELVGGLFYHNYPGGAGLMAGAVFGRTAAQRDVRRIGGGHALHLL
jgi:tricarballylate dehydrogenase